jgi:parvulin-like peptidyl-prolyl isomerase
MMPLPWKRCRYALLFGPAVGLLLLGACSRNEDPVVLEVGSTKVPLSTFQLAFWEVTARDTAVTRDSAGVAAFLEDYIKKEIMEHLAEQAIPEFDEDMEENYQLALERFMLKALDNEVFKEERKISEKDLREAYEKLKTQFRIREIRVSSEDKARRILERLEQGAVFGKVAAKESEDEESREREGDRGWVTLGQIPPEVYDVAASLRPGQRSGIIHSPLGYHIIQVEGRRETPEVLSYEEARPTLERLLIQDRVGGAMLRFQDELLKKYQYKLYPENVVWVTNWLRDATRDIPRGGEALQAGEGRKVPPIPPMDPEDQRRILATTTTDTLTCALLLVELLRYPPATWPTFDAPEDVQKLLRGMMVLRVRLAEARSRGLDKDPLVQWLAGKKHDAIRSRRFYLRFIRPKTEPTEEEIRAFYEEHLDAYRQREGRRALALHVKSRELALEAARRLRRGDDPEAVYQDLLREDSTAVFTGKAGTSRLYTYGESPQLDPILFSLKVGEVSDPIPVGGGYTVLKLLEIRPEGVRPLDEVREEIRTYLWTVKADEELNRLIEAARDTLPIRIHRDALAKMKLEPPKGWRPPREVLMGIGPETAG